MGKQQRHRLTCFFGRRGGVLALFGLTWIILGFGFATTSESRFSRAESGGLLDFIDSTPWPGIFWMICGAVAFGNGLLRRKLHNEDAIGYAVLIMPPLLWSIAYVWSFTAWAFTSLNQFGMPYGRRESFIGALVFLIIVLIIRIVANWRDDYDEYRIRGEFAEKSEILPLNKTLETREENATRGNVVREETERRIAESAAENDRLLNLHGRSEDERKQQE